MPAINKKATLKKAPKPAIKKPGKPKLISSQLGVTAVKTKPRGRHTYQAGKANRGVVFIKNIPHGFYEEQLKAYFEQFGQVTRTRVARSMRTGKSNGYAFVEFKVPEVGKIAAETMDNYLMFKQNLKTVYIAPEEQKYNYFREVVHTKKDADGVSHLVTPKTQRAEKAIKKINTMPTKQQHENRVERALYKLKKAQEYYTNKGINVDLSLAAQNKPEASDVKKLGKKDQKNVKLAKKQASKAKAHDTTLDRLLNDTIPEGEDESDESFVLDDEDEDATDLKSFISEQLKKSTKKKALKNVSPTLKDLMDDTIPEGVDESDESFVPQASDSDEEEEIPVESSNKRKKVVDTSKAPSKKSKSSVSSVDEIQPKVNAKFKKAAAAAASVAQVINEMKNKTDSKKKTKPSQPESSEDGDDEFTASTSNTAASTSSKSSVQPLKKNKKQPNVAVSPSSAESLPEEEKKKTSSTLLAKGGIQKRSTKKPISAEVELKKNKKGVTSSKKQLLMGATKLCTKVEAADLKKEKKKKNVDKKASR